MENNSSQVQKYELYYILPSSLAQDHVSKAIEKINQQLEAVGARNIEFVNQGLKKLQYKIKGNEAGIYILTHFDLDYSKATELQSMERNLNYNLDVIRYIIINQTEYLVQKAKEQLNPSPEFTDHRQLNKGRTKNKLCIFNYLGRRVVDYKEVDFLRQFMSPYAKILGRARTGLSAKAQRKVTKAIKQARHMALLPFVGE